MIFTKIDSIVHDDDFFYIDDFIKKGSLYLKIEHFNMAGSIKIKSAKDIIEKLETQNKSGRISEVVASSSGNFGLSLSVICCAKTYGFICVVDPNTNDSIVKMIRLFGGKIDCVTRRDGNGGFLNTRLERVNELLDEDSNRVFADQYYDPAAMDAHYHTTAASIYKQFEKVDYLFVGCGTAGTLMGCVRYIKENHLKTKVIAVDAAGSVSFGFPSSQRSVPGLGSSMRPPLLDSSQLDVVIVPESEGISMCHYVLKKYGLFLGGSSGMVLTALKYKQDMFKETDNCVAIMPDGGANYLDTVYDPHWLKSKGFNIPLN